MSADKYTDNYEVKNPELQAVLKSIGSKVGGALPDGWGFALFLFEMGMKGGATFYISSADRESVVEAMQEWMDRTQGEINPENAALTGLRDQWKKIVAILVHKYGGGRMTVTSDDIRTFSETGLLLGTDAHDPNRLVLRMMSPAEAEAMVKEDRAKEVFE